MELSGYIRGKMVPFLRTKRGLRLVCILPSYLTNKLKRGSHSKSFMAVDFLGEEKDVLLWLIKFIKDFLYHFLYCYYYYHNRCSWPYINANIHKQWKIESCVFSMVKSWWGKNGNMSDIFIAHTKLFGLLNVHIHVSVSFHIETCV